MCSCKMRKATLHSIYTRKDRTTFRFLVSCGLLMSAVRKQPTKQNETALLEELELI